MAAYSSSVSCSCMSGMISRATNGKVMKMVASTMPGTAKMMDDLVLSVGDEKVTFSPKGRNVVGSQGRIDVFGESGQAMLVVQPGPRWSVVTSRSPRLKIEPLDEQ